MSETLPGMSDRELYEAMTADQIVDTILAHGERASEIERQMSLGSDVLEGVYGLTVTEVLDKRERENNGETQAASS